MTTRAELDQLVTILNNRLGRPQYGWDRVGDKNVAHVGALTLDGAYGGWRLHEVLSASGAVREVGPRMTKSATADYLRAILAGIEFAEANVAGVRGLPRWDQQGRFCAYCGDDMYFVVRGHHHTENGVDVTRATVQS